MRDFVIARLTVSLGLGALVLLPGCGSDAGTTSAGGTGGDFNQGAGGSVVGAGGSVVGAGGSVVGAGGSVVGAGGSVVGAGGSVVGAGGTVVGAGGTTVGAGGTTVGAGGTTVGAGGTTAGAGGTTAGAGGTTAGSTALCIADPATNAIILGDSYVTGFLSPPMQPELMKLIPSVGDPLGTPPVPGFPNFAGAGCSMASGGVCTGAHGNVPQQATDALNTYKNLKFVIMDGGGNDILICSQALYPNCNNLCNKAGSSQQQVCKDIVDGAIKAASDLMTKTAAAGITEVIYFFYPHIPNSGGGYTEILDYAEPLARATCDGAEAATGGKLKCHWVSLVQPFKDAGGDMNAANFAADGIHPSNLGQAIIAKEIAKVMNASCIGLPTSSACCSM